MTLHSLRDRTLGVIPIRLGLGVALLGAARIAGAESGPALLAGVEAGLAVAALLSLSRVDPRLYIDPPSRAFYRRS